MNRIRTAALAALVVCAVSLGAAGTASAQEPAATPLTKKVALTGTKGFKGTYTIDRFTTRNGKLVVVGDVRGTMRKNKKTNEHCQRNAVKEHISKNCAFISLLSGSHSRNNNGLRIDHFSHYAPARI